MKRLPQYVENIKAETWLTTFTESCSEINFDIQGVFSRNYNEDVISADYSDDMNHKLIVSLSRDGLFHILPEGLFFVENTLRDVAKKNDREKFQQEEERIMKEKKKIRLFFQPFDTAYFQLRFVLEKNLNKLAENRAQILMDAIFDIYPLESDNPHIRKIIPLLPLASEIRGNPQVLTDLLRGVFFPATAEMFLQKKRKREEKARNILKINVYIEKLSAIEFRTLQKEGEEFAQFFAEWFLPVDLSYEFKIKDKTERFVLGKAMTLDYNTYL
jgi:hypothetical protein